MSSTTVPGPSPGPSAPVAPERRMDPDDRDELDQLMAALVDGDPSAVSTLIDRFGGQLAATVRRHLRDLHRDDVARDEGEVDSLVIDVALLLADKAGSWSPDGGALPWTWADRAIRALVVAHVGHARVDVEPDELEQLIGFDDTVTASSCERSAADDLDVLAERHPTVALLRSAIDEAATRERDAAVHLEYQVQKSCGDPSPAVTVGRLFGLSPDNVRQIDRRVRKRLLRLVDDEPAFVPLRELHWLRTRSPSAADEQVA